MDGNLIRTDLKNVWDKYGLKITDKTLIIRGRNSFFSIPTEKIKWIQETKHTYDIDFVGGWAMLWKEVTYTHSGLY